MITKTIRKYTILRIIQHFIKRIFHYLSTSPFRLGILIALLGYLGLSMVDFSLKYITNLITPIQTAFFLHLFNIMLTLTFMSRSKFKDIKTNNLKSHIFRGLSGTIGISCIITAFSMLEISRVYTIIFLAPIVVTILSFIFLKDKPKLLQVIGIILGFMGVLVVFQPNSLNFNWGYIAALVGPFTIAISGLIIKKYSSNDSSLTHNFYNSLVVIITLAIPAMWDITGIDFLTILSMFSISCLNFLAVTLAIMAIKKNSLQTIGIAQYMQVVWGFLIEFIFLSITPDIWAILGAILIVVGGFISINQNFILKLIRK